MKTKKIHWKNLEEDGKKNLKIILQAAQFLRKWKKE